MTVVWQVAEVATHVFGGIDGGGIIDNGGEGIGISNNNADVRIYAAEFSCPYCFPLEVKSLMHKILNPNSKTFAVNTVLQDKKEFLDHIIKSTNMKCLTPLLMCSCSWMLVQSYALMLVLKCLGESIVRYMVDDMSLCLEA
nr:coatomer subunit beta-1 [Quercus suber]